MMKKLGLGTVLLAGWLLAACTPTVALKAPEDPITINLNVTIAHEIRLKVEKDINQLFSEKRDPV